MTYLSFLGLFLILPLAAVSLLTWRAAGRNPARFAGRGRWAAGALLVHVALAVVYTTPWDNYLVAAQVWWYDPARVLGVIIGWVPLEEYFFFVLQTLLTGLIVVALVRRWPPATIANGNLLRSMLTLLAVGAWLAAVAMLALGWKPGTYLGLELAWALPPLALQLAIGADILWQQRRAVLLTLVIMTLYLSTADWLAVRAGIWTISPAQSLRVLIGGVLPIEEVVFFFLTNSLLIFGLTLGLAPEIWARWAQLTAALRHLTVQEQA